MKLKLYQPRGAMVSTALLGLLGLAWIVDPFDHDLRPVGVIVFVSAVVFWIVAFTVEPKPHPKWMSVAAGLAGAAFGLGLAALVVTR